MKKRADGRYSKQIMLGYHKDGRKKVKTIYGKTIKEVEKKHRELINSIEAGTYIEENITFGDWAGKWLTVYKSTVEHRTYDMYEKILFKHIIPALGNMVLLKIKSIHIQSLINLLVAEEKYRTAQLALLTIKQIFKQALQERLIVHDVAAGIKSVKYVRKKKRTLTDEERIAIESADLDLKQKVFVDIMLYAGLRRGEALALTKEDINLKEGKLFVNKSLSMLDTFSEIKGTKNNKDRVIPIPKKLFDELSNYIAEIEENKLFPMKNGEYMTKSSFNKFWKGIMKKILEADASASFTPHICRHTYATDLYYASVDIKLAQYLLGHSSLNMTLEIYTHLDERKIDDVSAQLDEYYRSKNSQNPVKT